MRDNTLMLDMENRNCPMCDYAQSKAVYTECGFNIAKCSNCNYMYMNPIPTASGFQKIYNDKYEYSEKEIEKVVKGVEKGEFSFFNDRLNSIKKYMKSGKLLDVGCNYGIFLRLSKEAGYDVCGIDISKPAVMYGREKFKLDIIEGTISEANFPQDCFDIVTMFDVLEHVIYPLKELEAVNRVLKKKGLFFMTTRNVTVEFLKSRVVKIFPFLKYYKENFTGTPFKANEFGIPYHINYFTPQTLKAMLLKAGFKNIEFGLCKGYKYQGRYARSFLRIAYTLLTKVFFKCFNICIAAEISVCAEK